METNSIPNKVHAFSGSVAFSAFQPIDVKPVIGRKWITNGVDNINFQRYKDAYDDSPTNSSIINAFVSYIFGEGLIDKKGIDLRKYISQTDVELMCQDYKTYGGCSAQVIWSAGDKPARIEYVPISKLGINVQDDMKVDGFWYSWDWLNRWRYKPAFYPKFDGRRKSDLEILYIRRPTSEPFFPIPDYFSGIPWTKVEGELANGALHHFQNGMEDITIFNYLNGRIEDAEVAKAEAERIRQKTIGTSNKGKVFVNFGEGSDESLVVDRISPPELNQQNVFYSEEAERKLIVAHSAPLILFSGSNQGGGFSNNADEREVATQELFRKHINPAREVILRGLQEVFNLINPDIVLDFKNFEAEKTLTEEENTVISSEMTPLSTENVSVLDDKTLEAQASLKGSVGGVQALLEIQASYAQGLTTYESAINMLDIIYGYSRDTAVKLLGKPKIDTTNEEVAN